MAGERIFVTGATGRIGLPLVRALVAAGHDVVGLARTEAGASAVAAAGAEPVRGDLASAEALRQGLQGARVVYHLAGGVRGPGADTPDVLNAQGTRHLLDAIAQVGSDTLDAVVLAPRR